MSLLWLFNFQRAEVILFLERFSHRILILRSAFVYSKYQLCELHAVKVFTIYVVGQSKGYSHVSILLP